MALSRRAFLGPASSPSCLCRRLLCGSDGCPPFLRGITDRLATCSAHLPLLGPCGFSLRRLGIFLEFLPSCFLSSGHFVTRAGAELALGCTSLRWRAD